MANRTATTRRVILAAGLLVGTAGLSGTARAADDGYENVFTSVLTAVGVLPQPDHSQTIDYRERAPLVLPPKQDLVTPEPAGAHRPAAWPRDPDVIARRKAEEDAKAPMLSMFDKRVERPESKADALRFRAAQTDNTAPDYCNANEHSSGHCRVGPDELRKQEEKFRATNHEDASNVVTAGVEPEREYLTQPPKGYMKVNKTVKVTAEAPTIERDLSKPLSTLLPHPYDHDHDLENN